MFSAKLRLTEVTDKDTLEAFVNEVCPTQLAAVRCSICDSSPFLHNIKFTTAGAYVCIAHAPPTCKQVVRRAWSLSACS